MSGTVSTRWFWSDWMSDPGLRACSYAARGLWQDLLCIAGSNKAEYGYVSLNGRKLDSAAIAKMTNGSLEEVETLIEELARNGVFSRDRRGVIYCRRMIRAEKNRSNGRLGGNPNLLKKPEKEKPVKPDPKPLIPKPEPKPEPKGKHPTGLFDDDPPQQTSDWPTDYREQFWSRYPRKTEKKTALEKLDAIAKGGKVPWLTFLAGLNRFVDKSRGEIEKYIKHPTTWLNRGCWDDVYRPDPPGGEHGENRKGGGIGFGAIAERLRAGAHAK